MKSFVAGILSTCILGGCFAGPSADSCGDNSDCQGGWLCIDKVCRLVCDNDRDCPSKTDACSESRVCVPRESPACATDGECVSPGVCQEQEGAGCWGGKCVYPNAENGWPCDDGDLCTRSDTCDGQGNCFGNPVTCTAPADECVAANTVFRDYTTANCDKGTGICQYVFTDTSCPDCSRNCLHDCSTVVCEASDEHCHAGGHCDASLDPPACVFPSLAEVGSPCMLDANDTELTGKCTVDGSCVACLADSDCGQASCVLVQDCAYASTCAEAAITQLIL